MCVLQAADECCPEERYRARGIWVILTWLFGFLSLVLFAALVSVVALNKGTRTRRAVADLGPCEPPAGRHTHRTHGRDRRSAECEHVWRTNGSDVFEELSVEEVQAVVDYLHSRPDLKLDSPNKMLIESNYIHSIEMKLPDKAEVLAYLNGTGPKPERMGTVYIFLGAEEPPSVAEYKVGRIGSSEIYAEVINTTRRQARIPFIYRPFSTAEFMSIFKYVLPTITKLAGHVLKESYAALPMKCGDQCLKISMAPIASKFLPEGRRKAWFWFQHAIEFSSVRPLDFQWLVDTTSVRPSEWSIENVWYANQMFANLTVFLEQYDQDVINKTRVPFPTHEEQEWSTMQFRTPLVPEEPLRAPRQYEPDGKRFTIIENEIHYLKWKMNFRISTTGGLQLLNIRFGEERIVYELSMQEVAVMYGGHNPYSQVMNYADGAGMYGTRYRGLLPGVDCPAHSEFVDSYLYTSNEGGGRIFEKGFCVFELNTHTPLRRHRAYGRSGALYGGLEGVVLVVRSIISVLNYDYIFDFKFYPTGAIETQVSMTGYLGTTFYFPEENLYGTRVHEYVSASLHNHLFHFKVDLDIKGLNNRYETLNILTKEEESRWFEGQKVHQTRIERHLKTSEQDSLFNYNFDTPKVHVFSNKDHISKTGNVRGYRVEITRMSKQQHSRGYGFEPAIPWARQQMAVTRYRPEEERSSSMFTMWDSRSPVVNFEKYIDDDDNIVDEVGCH